MKNRAALALVLTTLALACKSGDAQPSPASAASQAAAARADTEVAFSVTSRAGGACVAGAECTVKVHLVAAREYHVNEEYPYRFVPQPTAALRYAAPQPAFQKESEREGTLPISFVPKSAGPAKVMGTFKLSVCSKDVCLIEESNVAVDVVAEAAPPN